LRDLCDYQGALARGEITLTHVLDELYKNIESREPVIHAFLSLAEKEELLLKAEEKKAARLLGLPIAIKDNICTLEFPTTCGSRFLRDYRAPFEATAVARLRAAGAQVQGKTNLDEFAMGSSTEYSAYGPTRNPWDPERVPGGSSGGSAAAVAAGEALAALGSDTGGSVRQPAALCGVVGLRPTYGLVSRYGLVAFASSLDTIGPITRSVRDAALLLSLIAGHDPHDSTSLPLPPQDYLAELRPSLAGLRIGLAREYVPKELGPKALSLVEHWCGVAEELGAQVLEISLPLTEYALRIPRVTGWTIGRVLRGGTHCKLVEIGLPLNLRSRSPKPRHSRGLKGRMVVPQKPRSTGSGKFQGTDVVLYGNRKPQKARGFFLFGLE